MEDVNFEPVKHCLNCQGNGVVGQGDRPWTREGKIETCKLCAGTGHITTEEVVASEPVEEVSSLETEE